MIRTAGAIKQLPLLEALRVHQPAVAYSVDATM